MTIIGNIPTMSENTVKNTSPHSVAVLISDGLGTFEFGIAVEIFGLDRPEFDFPWYEFSVVNTQNSEVHACGGIRIASDAMLSSLKQVDTIIIPSWRSVIDDNALEVIKAIQHASKRGTRFLSICSGVFLLAAAGLLNGKKATSHWKHIPKLKALYPEIDIQEDTLYVDQGDIICSAGSAAGIDACLHLVRKDFGTKIANDVARRLVAHPHRDGGQAQFIPQPIAKIERHTMSESMDWALAQIPKKVTVKDMANHAHMSERTFLRRFREAVGNTPIEWLQRSRVYKAQELLETTQASLDDVAQASGYQSSETFRVAFKKMAGVSPGIYRSRFQQKT